MTSQIPGVGLGGLVPRNESAVLGEVPTPPRFCDFRTHGPRIRIDDLSAPSVVSSLVFLPPSPLPIAVTAAGGFCLQPTPL